LIGRIKNDIFKRKKKLGTKTPIDYIKRQQIKWFGHVKRQRELKITKSSIRNMKILGQPGNQEISSLLEIERDQQKS
jgi:hypothetical protein